jgi:hypothetical protein
MDADGRGTERAGEESCFGYTMARMSIDERLDKLTERHEALTQAVELIAHMQQRNEEAHQRNEVLMEKSQVLIAHVMESVDSLARIAHAHEQRITGLEDGRQ